MALLHYITYTEPVNTHSGNDVRFFVREFDTQAKNGRSLSFVKPVELIIPSFEIPKDDVKARLDELARDFPGKEFRRKEHSWTKDVIWYIENERKRKNERIKLPKYFLDEKISFSKQLRFYYPPFTMVQVKDGQLILPSKLEKSYIDLEALLDDKKGALDIEVVDYYDPRIERITNVVHRFAKKGYIITTFVPPFKEFRGYEIIPIRKSSSDPIDPKNSSDAMRRISSDIIQSEDPLGIYGYNLPYDQDHLRGDGGEYLPGVNLSRPVFKSVQGLRNMVTKGRHSYDIYCYKFLHFNHYENNKLETHARMEGMDFKKSLPYEILEYKTKKAEAGSVEDMIECLTYVAEDGDTMFKIGENNQRKILSKALFVKREPSSICTSSGKSVMKEYWEKQYFLRMNTLRDRYERGHKKRKLKEEPEEENLLLFPDPKKKKVFEDEKELNLGEYKNSLISLKRIDGIFKDVSIVYPLMLVKAFWPMIEGTTDNLRFRNPDERLDSYQTLDEYISQAVKDMMEYPLKAHSMGKDAIERDRKLRQFDFIMKSEYKIGLFDAKSRLEEMTKKFSEILDNSMQINHSNKFILMKYPEKLVEEGLGFVYGKGNCLSCGARSIVLSGNALIYQGFGISRGRKCLFDSRLMKGILKRKLGNDEWNEEEIAEYLKENMLALEKGEIKRGNLLFKDIGKKRFGGKSYGFSEGHELPLEEFIKAPSIDSKMYAQNFFASYNPVLKVIFGDYLHSMYDSLGLGGLALKIERYDEMEEVPF